jgi:peptidoglycan/LPS O-acetylase OafA/YrhL
MWIAFVRMVFPFFMGLLMFRLGWKIRVRYAFPIAAVLLAALFWMPWLETKAANGLFEAACIILAFPVIVAIGAGGQVAGGWEKACKYSGDISYPIYIIHYPFIYWYTQWNFGSKPTDEKVLMVAISMFALFITMAWFAQKYYDLPVRAWLKRKILSK